MAQAIRMGQRWYRSSGFLQSIRTSKSRGKEPDCGTSLFSRSCRNMLIQYWLVTGSSSFTEYKRVGCFYYGINLECGAVFLYFGVLRSPFQGSLLGQVSPSPIMVQSGLSRWATPDHLSLLLFPTVLAPPRLSQAEGPSPQLAPLYLKASPKKRKPLKDPRRQNPAAFQRLGFLTERRL